MLSSDDQEVSEWQSQKPRRSPKPWQNQKPWQSQKFASSRTRRPHQKSKNGCFECKRRKIKCDEEKPSCGRCILGLQNCVYLEAPPRTNEQKDKLSLPSPPQSSRSPSPYAPSCSDLSPSFDAPPCSGSPCLRSKLYTDVSNFSSHLSDADLYHHYLQHTSRTSTHRQADQAVFQIGMPTLALQNTTVFHSILAVSATCLCCDMISKEPPPNLRTISHILTTAYEHYGRASEQMREMMLQPDLSKPDALLASTILLVPFATSSQQVHHWIASRSGMKESCKLLSSTPRDGIVIMRGVRTMLQTLGFGKMSPSIEMTEDKDLEMDNLIFPELASSSAASPPPSYTHVMFPILAATIEGAFSKLQERLHFASMFRGDVSDLSACSGAFEVLKSIGMNTFSSSQMSRSASLNNTIEESFEATKASTPQISPWLYSYANRTQLQRHNEPLTRYFLTFLVQVPQTYLDLVLPLLDQRLESPLDTLSEDIFPALTMEQALALDIYAHWSVLMFLVEEESWWIGKLPVVTLTGMLNRFGDDFVERLWPECGKKRWWPANMLKILREINRRR